MEYVHKQVINFRDDRTPLQRRVSIGYEGDNLVERLEFVLPELVGGQVAKLMITGADAITLNRVDDGRYAVDLTREMIGPDGKRDAHVRIDGVSGQIWQGGPLRIVTGKLPDVEGEIERVYPTAVGQMLTAMAEHTGEMEAQEERVERAAQRAEEAAERAESGGGSGGPGEDGGYYQPSVTDGVLTWNPSKADMPGVPASDVRGPAGQDGQPGKDGADGAPGKSAYQYAQDGGYTGTEAEFAAKLAQELPEAYTLPVATADRLGGVIIGDGLQADETGRASTRKNLSLYASREVKDGETVNAITENLPGNIREAQIFIFFPKAATKNTRVTGSVGGASFYIPDGLDVTADKWCVLRYRPGRGTLSFSGEYAAGEGYTTPVKMIGIHLRPYPYDEVDVYYFALNNVAEGYPAGTKVDIYIG